jgi:hypothetical protein
VAILAFYGAGGAAPLPQFQMAALTLTVKRIFQVQDLGPWADWMAFFTWLHGQTPMPDIAASNVIVMTGGAVHAGGLMRLVSEKHWTFGSRLELAALQPAYRFRFRGAKSSGAQQKNNGQGQKEYFGNLGNHQFCHN